MNQQEVNEKIQRSDSAERERLSQNASFINERINMWRQQDIAKLSFIFAIPIKDLEKALLSKD